MCERSKYRKSRSWVQWDKLKSSPSFRDPKSSYEGILYKEIVSSSSIPGNYSTVLAVVESQARLQAVQALCMAVYWEVFRCTINRIIHELGSHADPKFGKTLSALSEKSQTAPKGEGPSPASRHVSSTSHSSYASTQILKRHMDSDGHSDDNGDPRPQKHKTLIDSAPCSLIRRQFACQFGKRSPPACGGTGWDSVTKLKDHLRKLHLRSDRCLRCGAGISDEASLDAHTTRSVPCEARHDYGRDGVDLSQWKKIENIVKEEGETPRDNDIDEWYRIWKILFPDFKEPADPWYENESISVSPSCDLTSGEHVDQAQRAVRDLIRSSTGSSLGHEFSYVSDTSSLFSITPSLVSDNSLGMSKASSLVGSVNSNPSPNLLSHTGGQLALNKPAESFHRAEDFLEDLSDETWETVSDFFPQNLDFTFNFPESLLPHLPRTPCANYSSRTFYNKSPNPLPPTYPPCSTESTKVLRSSVNSHIPRSSPNTVRTSSAHSPRKISENNISPIPRHDEDVGCTGQDRALESYSPSWDSGIGTWAEENAGDSDIIPVDFESIETCLKQFLEPDSEHTTRSISLFRAKWNRENLPPSPGVVSCATSEDSQTPGVAGDPPAINSLGKRGLDCLTDKNLPSNKRANENEGEDEEEDQRKFPKKQRVNRDPEDTYKGPKFCCHFHKQNPKKYCLQKYQNMTTREQKRWEKCAGQGSGELRHLMDDLKRHRIYDCEVCFEEFDTPDRYQNHIDDKKCDPRDAQSAPRRDGIDRFQWREIQKILRLRDKNESEKWMEIWKVLFPHASLPSSPWVEEEEEITEFPTSSRAVENVVDTWQKLIQADVLEGSLHPFDSSSHQRYELQLRRAFHIENGRPEPMRSVPVMPTPSSSGRGAYTPASDSHNSNFVVTPSFNVRDSGGIDGLRSPSGNGFSSYQHLSPNIATAPSLARSANRRMNDPTRSLHRRISTSAVMRNLEEEINSTREEAAVSEISSMPSPFLSTSTLDRAPTAVATNHSPIGTQVSHDRPATPTSPGCLIHSTDIRKQQLLTSEISARLTQRSHSTHSPSHERRFDSATHMTGTIAPQTQPWFPQTPGGEPLPSSLSNSRIESESHEIQVNLLRRMKELEDQLRIVQQSTAPQLYPSLNFDYSQGADSHVPTSMISNRSLYSTLPQPLGQSPLDDSWTSYSALRDVHVTPQSHLSALPQRASTYVYTPDPNTSISTSGQTMRQNDGDSSFYPSWRLSNGGDSVGENDHEEVPDYNYRSR